jgi:hypothetical protein
MVVFLLLGASSGQSPPGDRENETALFPWDITGAGDVAANLAAGGSHFLGWCFRGRGLGLVIVILLVL